MSGKKCGYLEQDSALTLREGIEEYYRANPHLLLPSDCSEEAARFFRRHDKIHVVFGCTTSFLDEVRADFWTILGSEAGLVRYVIEGTRGAVRELYRDLKKKVTLEDKLRLQAELKRDALAGLAVPLAVLKRSRGMTRKWPWGDEEQFLDIALGDLRRQFNIRVFH